eukprot:TRINITY_DN439_c0_g1_i1.p1 TRINITY_DN439_c0_g1~~TRINITY_DN439_c0_g1_i1.p1  ORF type:complete len:233 (-),score=23.51 TRINITY_DN439_c0_g1_i1:133-831(-)
MQNKIVLIFLFVVSFLVCNVRSQNCTSYTNCPAHACNETQYNTDIIIFLELTMNKKGFQQFDNASKVALKIMGSEPGVITNDDLIFHTTLQYLCCYDIVQYNKVINVISKIQWKPFNITFGSAFCNFGGDGDASDNSIIIGLDAPSQVTVANFVDNVENAILNSGLPIIKRRANMEPFHSTLGVVSKGYPIDSILQKINQAIPVYNTEPIVVDSFTMLFPPFVFNANTSLVD